MSPLFPFTTLRTVFLILATVFAVSPSGIWSTIYAQEQARPKLLFLGDNGHHQPAIRFKILEPVLKKRGIDLTYTDIVEDLNATTLSGYAGLIIYANIEAISPQQETALLDFVANGKGFIPLHCASFCFLNSAPYVDLVGAQFQRHSTGTFRTIIANPDHPIMRGFKGFESWDETYVHTRHNTKDRLILEYRQEGKNREPWTWVRSQGQGRVFYTAWGHDERTWNSAGFQNLVERGIRWAIGGDPSVVPVYADRPDMTTIAKDVKPFDYVDAEVPFYPPGKQWGTLETGKRKMQKPLPPEESMKHMVTPVGFEVKLFASEKDFQGKPIFMTWDERGRLWICETKDYPNDLQEPSKGNDLIRICEDTNQDGIADKFTVFADKLSIPTSLAFYRGGVICQNGVETVFLRDTTGDDQADERTVLVTGWALGDTHGGVSNFRYGLDNWYWAMQGYNQSKPVIANGKAVSEFRMGFFRFRTAGGTGGKATSVPELEFLRSTNNNTWGLGQSEEGFIFGSTANGNPSVYLPIPNRYYESVRGWSSSVLGTIADNAKYYPITENIRQVDNHGSFTAAAGHSLYTARNYPHEYWNRTAFVTGPDGHLAATFVIEPEGADFKSRNAWNLLASDDEWTAPIQAEVGPDGNVWVLDWYNYIVQHNPTPAGFKTGKGNAYETELRDKKHGRIYRVVHKAARKTDLPNLNEASSDKLLATLKHTNMFWRLHAQRLLVERGDRAIVPELLKLVEDNSVDEIGLNVGAIHALWTLHGLGLTNGQTSEVNKAITGAFNHPSAGVRQNAVQVAPRDEAGVQAILASQVWRSPEAQVRLASLLTLAEVPPSKSAGEMVEFLLVEPGIERQKWLVDAIISAAARHDYEFLGASIRWPRPQLPSETEHKVLAIVAEHYARSAPESVQELVRQLPGAIVGVSSPILAGLSKGWPKNKTLVLTEATDQAILDLLTKVPASTRGELVNLGMRWGSKTLAKQVEQITKGFLEVVTNPALPDPERLQSARMLIDFRKNDVSAANDVLSQITPRSSVDFSVGILEAVGSSDASDVGQSLLGALSTLTPAVRPIAFRLMLSRTDWTNLLLDGIEQGKLRVGELSLEQKQALNAHVDRAIRDRAKSILAKGGGLPNPDRQKVIDELLPILKTAGDPVAGKAVFKKTCAKCHTHSGEGVRIGPDLTGMAVHPKHELLIHIMDPSRSVEGNYRIYTVATDDGKVYSGLLTSESKTAIELVDIEAKKHSLLRENIEELVASTKSLMPEGMEKQHTPEEINSLLEFLTQRGKFLPLSLDKVATSVSTKGMFLSEQSDVERLIFPDWTPKTVEGVPFVLIDPQGDRVPNVILMHGPSGTYPPRMPKNVTLPCQAPSKAIHFLSGVSGWGFPFGKEGTVSLIVRLHYADGKTEDHPLKNGIEFADYIRRVDVPGSKLAFMLRGQQIRYFSVIPQRQDVIKEIELIKGPDTSAPVVMAVTVESP